MLRRSMFVSLAVFCLLPSLGSAAEIVLAENGKSAYRIVVADDASPSTRHGAEELQTFLEQIERRQAADRLRPRADRPRRKSSWATTPI